MGTKVPLVTAAHIHSKSHGHNSNIDRDIPPSLSRSNIMANMNGSSTGLYPSQSSATYGSTGQLDRFGVTRIHSSPERQRRNSASLLNRVPEDDTMDDHYEDEGARFIGGGSLDGDEEEFELDEELAAEGLYRGSYRRLLILYSLVPLTFILVFTLLAVLPPIAWPIASDHARLFPYPPYFPFPLPEFLLPVALWSLSYILRDPIFTLGTFLSSLFSSVPIAFPILLSMAFHSIISLLLQQSAIALLLVPYYMAKDHPTSDGPAFRRVWSVALGWAVAEAVAGIQQGYAAIGLYRDVLVSVHRPYTSNGHAGSPGKSPEDNYRLPLINSPTDASPRPTSMPGNSANDLLNGNFEDEISSQPEGLDTDEVDENQPLFSQRQRKIGQQESELQMQLERDVDKILLLRSREELEEVYGMPVIDIPVFISCLQRVNAILFSLGVYLLVSSAYIRSTIALSSSSPSYLHSNTPLKITLPLVLLLQFSLGLLHTSLVLPRIGVHTVVYAGSLVSLGSFFAGLGMWGALS